jgi:hypothetical protein
MYGDLQIPKQGKCTKCKITGKTGNDGIKPLLFIHNRHF